MAQRLLILITNNFYLTAGVNIYSFLEEPFQNLPRCQVLYWDKVVFYLFFEVFKRDGLLLGEPELVLLIMIVTGGQVYVVL